MLRFPETPEVLLQDAPLDEVVCQVRFPTRLRIIERQPVDLQERVRKQFPYFETEEGITLKIDPGSSAPPNTRQARIFRFRTPDKNSTFSLAPDFFALSTTRYQQWSDFSRSIEFVTHAVTELYEIDFATRVGLRYINKLTPESAEAENIREVWRMFRPELTALWSTEAWDEPVEAVSRLLLANEGDERLTLQVAFKGGDNPFCKLDFDYYEKGELPIDSVVARSRRYHDVIHNAFRWCIRDSAIDAFRPQ